MAAEQRPRIWMHCASLGEFEQGRPVLEQIRKQFPRHALVLTFFSPSGYEVRKNYEGADHVYYLPIDSKQHAAAFLGAVQPAFALFVKYELWYYYLTEMKQRGIDCLLLSAIFHKDQMFFKPYGSLPRQMLRCFSHLFVQDHESATLLEGININNVTVSGDTRFDRVIEAVQHKKDLPIADGFAKDAQVIVAGSTWNDDEHFLCKALQLLPPNWKLLLVPHEVNEGHLKHIESKFEGESLRWSQIRDSEAISKRVLIVDTVGLLLQLYRYGTVAWIGGGFGKDGVHNVLEAAVYGIPVYYGPIFHQFAEAQALIDNGGAFTISDTQAFAQHVQQWENSIVAYEQVGRNARQYVQLNGGATEKIMDHLLAKYTDNNP